MKYRVSTNNDDNFLYVTLINSDTGEMVLSKLLKEDIKERQLDDISGRFAMGHKI